ncbi:hypothetical protein [Frigoribacterium sp. MCBA15_019]|uniref:hypothetical protein n=1 Tax=Frigoribacterium sp. MCBA15_019 TaxID=1898745 RepID=UPI0008DD3DF0|nr:hypothetical protein [Frigoribacterium sp. MCBA15_019]OII27561.1 hypothetical protein BIV04_03225 [Frigoribacterium sp. MCBA15_019]
MAATYSWLAVEARTGVVIADLPDLSCDKVSTQIGTYTTTTAKLPVGTRRTPENWLRATKPGATFLVVVDDASDLPVWGGLLTKRTRTEGDTIDVSLATAEAYFDRRYVGDEVFGSADPFVGVDQNTIVTTLVAKYAAAGSNGGLPLRLERIGSAGTARTRTYADQSDKTLYSALTELMAVDGGPEWTVGWERTGTIITPVLQVGTRLGRAVTPNLSPNATFEIPGPVSDAEYSEDYSSSGGANDVLATSSASGDERPQSRHVVTRDPERPTFEQRFSPSTSITDVGTLEDHATARAAAVRDGALALSLGSVTKSAPRVGIDWNAGDDIGYVVGGPDRLGRETVPGFPGGLTGVARAVGWELSFESASSPEKITPVLQDPEEA